MLYHELGAAEKPGLIVGHDFPLLMRSLLPSRAVARLGNGVAAGQGLYFVIFFFQYTHLNWKTLLQILRNLCRFYIFSCSWLSRKQKVLV